MVMHARKLPRLDDGYFDKHQSHSYQAGSKYSSSKGSYDRYNDRARDSPNGAGLRSDSPNSFGDSPRDRSYVHKSSYAQRIRDKDRERDRDNRSPRDRDRTRDSDRRSSNHDRGSTEEKPSRVGDWSEHVSSSGKKYYYNCKSEVSQWEKPRDWVDWEKDRDREERDRDRYRRDRDRDRDRKYERSYSSRSKDGPSERHSSFTRPSTNSNNSSSSGNANSSRSNENRDNYRNNHQSQQSLPEPTQSRRHSYERPSQDMDISPADSTPTSEASGPKTAPYTPDARLTPQSSSGAAATAVSLATALPRLLSHPPSNQPIRPASQNNPNASNRANAPNLMSPLHAGGSTSMTTVAATAATSLSSLQQLLTQLTRTTVSGSMTAINPAIQSMLASTLGRMGNITALGSLQNLEHMELPAHEVLQSLQTLLSSSQIAVPASNVATLPKNMNSIGGSSHLSDGGCQSSVPTPPEGDPAGGTNGPPTPTHSERLEVDFRRGSPATSLSSLSAAAASLRPSASSSHALTPSLAAHYRPDLISHVTGWAAEHLEKQAMKVSEELHTIGNLHVTRVSAELKMARSLVRVADIQATLQEQRILFLRQQMKELEELKPPNHFMSD